MGEQKVREMEAGSGENEGNIITTKDGSVDLKGRPAIRSKHGGWRACYFIVVYEAFERMAFYGITSNLVLYLTRELRQGTVTSANNVTYWMGTSFISTVLGAYVADAFFGRFWTFTAGSLLYFSGLCLLTAAVSFPSLKPPPCDAQGILDTQNCKPSSSFQIGIFFSALYILALGTGGTKPNISTIGADQFDDFDPKERAYKVSFFNWWTFSVFIGALFANVILVYVQDNISWSLGYGIPTIGLGISLLIFYSGTRFYRHKAPDGSPLTKMARVLVAAVRNRRLTLPKDPLELYELELCDYTEKRKFKIKLTNSIRFLNKAAIQVGADKNPWKLCPVTHIEETKQILRLFPVLLCSLIPETMIAQIYTLFIKQGTTLDRHMGPHFQIPPASLVAFNTITMLICLFLYDQYFVKIMRTWTKNPRGITLLQRLGTGFVIEVTAMLVAALVEMKRLSFAREHGTNGGQVPLTIFILLPQFVLMGMGEAFLVVARLDFFYDQAPEGMKSMGSSLSLFSHGTGMFLSSFLLSAVASITRRNGGKGWIENDLNVSHLDYYYGFLFILCLCNIVFFMIMCRHYVYKAEIFESLEEEKDDKFQSANDINCRRNREGEQAQVTGY